MDANPTAPADRLPANAFYRRQIAFLEAGDVDGLMTQYHPDAVMATTDVTNRGGDAIRAYMTGYLDTLGFLRVESTDKFTAASDFVLFEATARSDLGLARVYDVFVLRDDKATHHFAGVLSFEPTPNQEPNAGETTS